MQSPVAVKRAEIIQHEHRVETVNDLMAGQKAMRAKKGRYVKQYADEDPKKWEHRVNNATLLNAYERTLAYLTGQVFSKDIKIKDAEKTDPVFEAFMDNVDGQGNNMTVFGKRCFAHDINDGYGLILVDSSAVQTQETPTGRQYWNEETKSWLPLTAADAERLGLRPRLIEVRSTSVLGWRFETVGSRTRLAMLRIMECYKEEGEYDAQDVEREQIRVLRPGSWELWRKADENKDDSWFLHSSGSLPGEDIPVAVFRPGKFLSELTCAPALEALADKNVEHYQKQAQHNALMEWVRNPGMYSTGVQTMEGESLPWGCGVLTEIPNENGKIVAIGVDAASVAASQAELKEIESQMALWGLQLLMPRTGDVTATEKALSSAESDSTLKGWAVEFEDALNQAMQFVAIFMGMPIESAPMLDVNTEFHAIVPFDDSTLVALVNACINGKLPVELLWSELRRRGIIDEEWDAEKIKDLLLQENRDATFAGPTARFLATTTPGQEPKAPGSPSSGEPGPGQPQTSGAA